MSQQSMGRNAVLSPALATLGVLAAIVAAAVSLWRVPSLHSYIVGVGAGLAALLAPLSGLVSPQTKGKWQFAVILSAIIGLGVWFGADSMAAARDLAELRMQTQRNSMETALANLPSAARAPFILGLTKPLKQRFNERQFVSVIDLANIILTLDESNGHGLYYTGEAYRCLFDRTDMRGALQHYLAEANRDPESRDGDAATCYERPHGYCGERTAWINHLMANDYVAEANTVSAAHRADLLLTAYQYEHHVLDIRPAGFYRVSTIRSSCETLAPIQREMRTTKQSTSEIDHDMRILGCAPGSVERRY